MLARRTAPLVAVIAAVAALAVGLAAHAAATPSSGATCVKDLWRCTEWGACADGSRTRACDLANDCPDVETPKPPEREACVVGAQGCTADTWSCEDWLPCDPRGGQHRDCRMTIDCAGVQTVKPMVDRLCPTLQCDLPELRDRIACRLKLEPSGLEREKAIRYLPELCRSMTGLVPQDACAAMHRSFDKCVAPPKFEDRVLCAKDAFDLAGDLKQKAVDCKEMDQAQKDSCLFDLRKKVHDLVLFRLYDLEKRAQGLENAGAPFDAVVDLSAAVEKGMIAFDAAVTDEAREKAVKDVRAAWQTFLLNAKPYLR